MIFSRN